MGETLKSKFLTSILTVSFIGILILTLVYYYTAKNIITSNIEELTRVKVEKLVSVLDNDIELWKNTIEMFSQYSSVRNLEGIKFFQNISSKKHLIKDFETIAIVDKDGKIEDNLGYKGDIGNEEFFKKAITSGIIISEPIRSKVNNKPIIIISAPIKDTNNETIGIVIGKINMNHIIEVINKEKIDKNGYGFMLDNRGCLMAYPEEEKILKLWHEISDDKDLNKVCLNMINGKEGIEKYNFHGEAKLVAYRHLYNAPWSVAMTASYKEAFKDIFSFKIYMASITIVTLVIIMFVLYKLIDSLTNPLKEINQCMKVAASGNLDISCKVNSKDELGSLSQSLNTLITENRRLIRDIKETDRKKMDFFANISHEIKTPVNVISSTIQLLQMYGSTAEDGKFIKEEKEKFKYYLDVMGQNNLRIIRYIDNLIDLTELDAGILSLKFFTYDIVKIVEDIVVEANLYIKNNNSHKRIIFDTNVEERYIVVDKEKIERIVLNLISNAFKSTENSSIIEVEVYDKGNMVEIIVKDKGKGIPEDKQKYIFERYSQVDNLLNRNHEGSGIGLYLVKTFVELHKGKIDVISKEGEGSEFKVSIPTNLKENIKEYKIIEKSIMQKVKIEFSDIYYLE